MWSSFTAAGAASTAIFLTPLKGWKSISCWCFYDQRGSLRSPCPSELISVDKHVQDLECLREQLGVDRLNIVAHSMGTILAMMYLDRYPERVKGLVFISPSAPRSPFEKWELELLERHEQAKQAFFERQEIDLEIKRQGLDREWDELSDKEKTNAWSDSFRRFKSLSRGALAAA